MKIEKLSKIAPWTCFGYSTILAVINIVFYSQIKQLMSPLPKWFSLSIMCVFVVGYLFGGLLVYTMGYEQGKTQANKPKFYVVVDLQNDFLQPEVQQIWPRHCVVGNLDGAE